MTLFRIDDVSRNTSFERLDKMLGTLLKFEPDCEFLLAVSPIVFEIEDENPIVRERPFPAILNAFSNKDVFFDGGRIGIPDWLDEIKSRYANLKLAAHGLFHVDHRLLEAETQNLSIRQSCAIVGSKLFVPPFNKWTDNMVAYSALNGFELVIWEEGWRHLKYQKLESGPGLRYYFHTHDFSDSEFDSRFES